MNVKYRLRGIELSLLEVQQSILNILSQISKGTDITKMLLNNLFTSEDVLHFRPMIPTHLQVS